MSRTRRILFFAPALLLWSACTAQSESEPEVGRADAPLPRRIVDLSPVITEDLPVRIWGHKLLSDFGFRDTTEFEDVVTEDPLYVVDSYLTLFNHAGPHLDAANHFEKGAKSVDQYSLDRLIGRARLLDFRSKPRDEAISLDEIQETGIRADEIAMLMVGYTPPIGDELPSYPYLSIEAAEYLATLPVRAFVTDALGVESVVGMYEAIAEGAKGYKAIAPLHHAFLTREIPLFEQVENLDQLVGLESVVFVGFPLKIKGSNGSPIRAAALIY